MTATQDVDRAQSHLEVQDEEHPREKVDLQALVQAHGAQLVCS
jgi:hypothetical protein